MIREIELFSASDVVPSVTGRHRYVSFYTKANVDAGVVLMSASSLGFSYRCPWTASEADDDDIGGADEGGVRRGETIA